MKRRHVRGAVRMSSRVLGLALVLALLVGITPVYANAPGVDKKSMTNSQGEVTAAMPNPGTQEQEGLEKGVRSHMEQPAGVSAEAQCEEHQSQLANGRIGQDFLDVVLRNSDRGSKQSSSQSDNNDQVECKRR